MPASDRDAEVAETLEQLDVVVATLRAFLRDSGAEHVAVLLDQGDERLPTLVEIAPGVAAEVAEGEQGFVLPADAGSAATPLPLPALKPLAAPEVDAEAGEIIAPMNAIAYMATGVRELARLFGGRSVATVRFASSDPETPLVMAAREGDPMVLALGEHQYEMEPGWPG